VNQVTPASLRYPLSVFNKNSTLKEEKKKGRKEKRRRKMREKGGEKKRKKRKREGDGFRGVEERGY